MRLAEMQRQWDEQIDHLVTAYLAWKASAMSASCPDNLGEDLGEDVHRFSIPIVKTHRESRSCYGSKKS